MVQEPTEIRGRSQGEHHRALYRVAARGTRAVDTTSALDGRLPAYPDGVNAQLLAIGKSILATENFETEVPPIPAVCNSLEGARYRDQLATISTNATDPQKLRQAVDMVADSLMEIGQYSPQYESDVYASVQYYIPDMRVAVQDVILPFYRENDYNLFKNLRKQIDQNLNQQRGVVPTDYRKDDVVDAYLRYTPLEPLFDVRLPFSIPEQSRFEHTHMVAGTGHGKTQTLQYQILRDIADGKTVVVIDSQRQLIENIKQLDIPKERYVLIDPEDIAFPVALNLFAVGQERFGAYGELEREQLRTSIVELYEFVLASIMDTPLTGQQAIIFRYTTRLMLEIPGATLRTFLDVLEQPKGSNKYAEYITKLEDVPRQFFYAQFDDNEFQRMRKAVVRRLYLILENKIFANIFSNPETKLDLFNEMNQGKIILINTSKATLKETGTKTFGRFFIALIAQVAAERALISNKHDTIVYLDEAHEYLDKNVNIILSQARKQRIGMVMAHQYLGQLSQDLQKGLEANTSIKMAGGVSASDATALAKQMNCTSDLIQDASSMTWATYVRGNIKRALPVSYSTGVMEAAPKRTDMDEFIAYQREMYAISPRVPPTEGEGFTMEDPPEPKPSQGGATVTDEPSAGGDW